MASSKSLSFPVAAASKSLSFPAAAQSNKGTPAARKRIKSGGGAREKKENSGGAREEQGKDDSVGEEQVQRRRDGRRRRRGTGLMEMRERQILGFLSIYRLLSLSLARGITLLPFHLHSTRGTASGLELVPRSTNLCQPLDLPGSNGRESVPQARSLVLSNEDDLALERELMMLNKPYVKSFKDSYGVVFDCVDIYRQPAFDHPLLKNHKLQIPPRSYSKSLITHFGLQESCPDGTVLIRRTLKEDLLRARAFRGPLKPQKDQSFTPMSYTSTIPGQHFALLLINSEEGSKFQATGAVLEVYPLNVQQGQSSSAQILLVDDSSNAVSVIQSGWHVDPDRESDTQTRLVTYWTADDYHKTGCMNMLCPGFVLLSRTTSPGMVLTTGSIPLNMTKVINAVHHIALNLFNVKKGACSVCCQNQPYHLLVKPNFSNANILDIQTGNWQVVVGDEVVGYFPKEIINGMSGGTEVQMGGIVYASPGQKSPPMGNGIQPVHGGNYRAARFTWVAAQGARIANWTVARDVADINIYDATVTSSSGTGPEGAVFEYGGPGGQP
uniref:Carboxyl-terminal proteinase-like n=1 Tax=Oryza sativa subsp. japonica TaxID=39947 RepID=Q6ZAJ4_ORYSJ|nr:carboxyl-terminal proteinase-like [Oryza sativa Japonica Group]